MIEIRTLGRTSVAVDGEPLSGEAAWPKSLALLVYMAREPGPDRRDEILGVLWPERDEKRARRALNQLLYTLRKTSPQLTLESVEDAVDFGREVWLDVEEFERRLEANDPEGAVALYEGPFLADLAVNEPDFDHWADRQRADLQRKFRKAALELASQAREAGDLDGAVAHCRRLVDSDTLDDEAQHLLIESLYARGDRVAALRQYEVYRDLLARELEVEPLEHTRELVERIRSEPQAAEGPQESVTSEGEGEAGEAADREETVEAPPVGRPRRPPVRRSWLAAGAMVVAAVLAVVFWPWRGDGPGVAGDEVLAAESMRVAVLPFALHGFGNDDEGLSAGVAQLLAINLEELGSLEIVPHHTVLDVWERGGLSGATALTAESLAVLAVNMQATSLILGDLHASGDEFRIVAELVGGRTGEVLARADVRGPRDSLFGLLDELALSLAADLSARADTTEAE
ncbi:MAG: BTAD domain-containing putative transcriptional regulator [Gemmatimonadales bacterium]|jgi:DNA-binding SARP family transcriptional activator/TolB-like protein